MSNNTQILDCVEGGSGTCRNADLIEQLRADLGATRAALEAVEWVTVIIDGLPFLNCGYCHQPILAGHATDCPRQVALGLAKKPEETK